MTEVYVVTQGEYSDYHIVGIYDDADLAARLIEGMKDRFYHVELKTFTLNPGADSLRQGLIPFHVVMKRNGNEATASPDKDFKPYFKLGESEAYARREGRDPSRYHDVNALCWARDEQHAIKIINEKRLMALASLGD